MPRKSALPKANGRAPVVEEKKEKKQNVFE
jgi:hypothetical protein